MGFLELRQEPGVYSRVTAGMSIRNSSLFSLGKGMATLSSIPAWRTLWIEEPGRLSSIASHTTKVT